MKNLILYGAGERCRILLRLLQKNDDYNLNIVDSNPQMWNNSMCDYVIHSPEVLRENNDAIVCVTFFSPNEDEPIWKKLQNEYGIDRERLITFHELIFRIYRNIRFPILNNVSYSLDTPDNYCFDFSWNMGLGGVEIWLHELRQALDNRKDIDIKWLMYSTDYSKERDLFDEDIIINGIKEIKRYIPCKIVFSRVDEMMLSACLLKRLYPHSLKIIMAVHGASDGILSDILSYRNEIDSYVCVSSAIIREINKRGIPLEKMYMMSIPVGYVDHDRQYSDSNSPIKIGFAGRLERFQKRVDLIPMILEELEKRKINYVFSIVGEGKEATLIEKYISKHSLNSKVMLLGRIDRSIMPDFWIKQDIALNLSDSEGRSLSNLEAMAAGCVPIVTDVPGTMEDVIDGKNGFVVSRGDYVGLTERIQFLYKHRDQLIVLGQQAKMDINPKINMEKHLDLWEKIFRTE